jgi:hypothetical protein
MMVVPSRPLEFAPRCLDRSAPAQDLERHTTQEAIMIARSLLAGLGITLAAGAAFAHHGWGSYDAAKKFTITSAIETIDWQNPHVHVRVKHEGGTWEAVLAPPFRMDARGLNPDLIKAGTQVEGYPSTRTEREMRAERITVAGKTYELR